MPSVNTMIKTDEFVPIAPDIKSSFVRITTHKGYKNEYNIDKIPKQKKRETSLNAQNCESTHVDVKKCVSTPADAKSATVRITAYSEHPDILNPGEISDRGTYIGSGFFIDSIGHIVTCYHVIEDSVKLKVNVTDQGAATFTAKLIGVYPEMDLAVIKIEGYTNHKYFKLGDSDKCPSETPVIAIGYPHGVEMVKMTSGVVSGVKDIYIQTDTAINVGNSGGPLVNTKYEVIGINTSKRSGKSEGTGYSTPINIFKTKAPYLLGTAQTNLQKVNNIFITSIPNLQCKFQKLDKHTKHILSIELDKNPDELSGYMFHHISRYSVFELCSNKPKSRDILTMFDGKTVDDYGFIDTNTSMGKMPINHYVSRCPYDEDIKIQFTSLNPWEIKMTTIKFKNIVFAGIREVYYPSTIEYANVDGIIFCNLIKSHHEYALSDNFEGSSEDNRMAVVTRAIRHLHLRDNKALIITKILPTSTCMDEDMSSVCDFAIIKKVNGQYVSTIKELNDIINRKIELHAPHHKTDQTNKYIMLELENNNIVSLSIKPRGD